MVKEMNALVEGTPGAEFVSELKPLENEKIVLHQRVGAFYETDLDQILKDLGVEKVLTYGVVTNNIVEHSVRNAVDLGYTVLVAEDCCSAATPSAHEASIESQRLLAHITTVEDIQNSLVDHKI